MSYECGKPAIHITITAHALHIHRVLKISGTHYRLIVYPIYCNKYRINIVHQLYTCQIVPINILQLSNMDIQYEPDRGQAHISDSIYIIINSGKIIEFIKCDYHNLYILFLFKIY